MWKFGVCELSVTQQMPWGPPGGCRIHSWLHIKLQNESGGTKMHQNNLSKHTRSQMSGDLHAVTFPLHDIMSSVLRDWQEWIWRDSPTQKWRDTQTQCLQTDAQNNDMFICVFIVVQFYCWNEKIIKKKNTTLHIREQNLYKCSFKDWLHFKNVNI